MHLLSKNVVPNLQCSIKLIRELATPDQEELVIEPFALIETNKSKLVIELVALIEANSETKPIVELDALIETSSDTRIDLDSRVRSLEDSCDRAERDASWRSTRAQKPKIFGDIVTHTALAADRVEPELVGPIDPIEAISVEDAMQEDAPSWLEAVDSELSALKQTKTYSVVSELPEERHTILNRWVFRKKLNANAILARRKARLVVKGFK